MLSYSNLLADLKSLRIIKKTTQASIASHLSISKDAYRKMEKGISPISIERLIQICTLLETDIRDLLDRNLKSKPQWEYEAEISRLQDGIHELKLERERLWTLINKMMRLLDPEASDEVFRMLYRKA